MGQGRTRWFRVLVPFVVATFVYGVWLQHTRPPIAGDEPCYLAQAFSLAEDADLELSDDLRPGSPTLGYSPALQVGRACATDFHGDGTIRSWFNPGLPLILAPAVRLFPDQLRLIRMTMVLVSALWAQQLFALLLEVSRRRRVPVVSLVWGAATLLLPAIGFSNQLLPELPAALCLTVAARIIVRGHDGSRGALGVGLLMAPLPWLHPRFAVLAAGVVAVGAAAGVRRGAGGTWAGWVADVVRRRWFVPVPLVLSAACMCAMYLRFFGSASPSAGYAKGAPLIEPNVLHAYRIGVGTLLGTTSGIVPVNLLVAVGLVGLGIVVARWRALGAAVVALAIVHLFLVSPLGYFGYALPGRFALVLIPLFAVGALLVVERSVVATAIAAVLCTLSLIPLAAGWRNYGNLYDVSRPASRWAATTKAVWPVVEDLPGPITAGYFASSSPGRVGGPGELPNGAGAGAVAPASAGPGLVTGLSELELRRGSYDLAVEVAGGGPVDASAGTLRVRSVTTADVLAERHIRWGDLEPDARGVSRVGVVFFSPGEGPLRIEVETAATGDLAVGLVDIRPRGPVRSPSRPVRDGYPLGALWLGALAGVAFALGRAGDPSQRVK